MFWKAVYAGIFDNTTILAENLYKSAATGRAYEDDNFIMEVIIIIIDQSFIIHLTTCRLVIAYYFVCYHLLTKVFIGKLLATG